MNKHANYEPLALLLAYLRAAQQAHWTAHWQAQGSSFYGDHLLFERLYSALSGEIDTLAEKLVAKYGAEAVDLSKQMASVADLGSKWGQEPNLVARAFLIEEDLQGAIESVMGLTDEASELSLGLENFLGQLADSHETALYLLGQRLDGGRTARAAQRVASRYRR